MASWSAESLPFSMRLSTVSMLCPSAWPATMSPAEHRAAVEEDRVRAGESFTVVGTAHGGNPDALEKRLEALSRFGGNSAGGAVEGEGEPHVPASAASAASRSATRTPAM